MSDVQPRGRAAPVPSGNDLLRMLRSKVEQAQTDLYLYLQALYPKDAPITYERNGRVYAGKVVAHPTTILETTYTHIRVENGLTGRRYWITANDILRAEEA